MSEKQKFFLLLAKQQKTDTPRIYSYTYHVKLPSLSICSTTGGTKWVMLSPTLRRRRTSVLLMSINGVWARLTPCGRVWAQTGQPGRGYITMG